MSGLTINPKQVYECIDAFISDQLNVYQSSKPIDLSELVEDYVLWVMHDELYQFTKDYLNNRKIKYFE